MQSVNARATKTIVDNGRTKSIPDSNHPATRPLPPPLISDRKCNVVFYGINESSAETSTYVDLIDKSTSYVYLDSLLNNSYQI